MTRPQRIALVLGSLAIGCASLGCGSSLDAREHTPPLAPTTPQGASAPVPKSVERTPPPTVEEPEPKPRVRAARSELVERLNGFAVDLYKASEREGNVVMAPLSLATSLSVIARWNHDEGPESATSARLEAREAGYHEALSELLGQLRGSMPTKTKFGLNHEEHILRLASSLWLPKRARLDRQKARVLAAQYGTEVRRRVYLRPERAALAVRHHMRQVGRVQMRLAQEVFADPRAFVVASAIDFEAEWDLMFVGGTTGEFHVDGKAEVVPTPWMQQVRTSRLYTDKEVSVSEVFYSHKDTGAAMAMTFVVPKAVDGLAQLEASLTIDRLEEWIAAMEEEGAGAAALQMPPWTTHYAPGYGAALQRMGLGPDEALGPSALHVRHAFGQAEIEVNEYGTRATETNLVGGVLGGVGGPTQELRLDRPFLYLIRDTRSGTIAFIGRVTDPRS